MILFGITMTRSELATRLKEMLVVTLSRAYSIIKEALSMGVIQTNDHRHYYVPPDLFS